LLRPTECRSHSVEAGLFYHPCSSCMHPGVFGVRWRSCQASKQDKKFAGLILQFDLFVSGLTIYSTQFSSTDGRSRSKGNAKKQKKKKLINRPSAEPRGQDLRTCSRPTCTMHTRSTCRGVLSDKNGRILKVFARKFSQFGHIGTLLLSEKPLALPMRKRGLLGSQGNDAEIQVLSERSEKKTMGSYFVSMLALTTVSQGVGLHTVFFFQRFGHRQENDLLCVQVAKDASQNSKSSLFHNRTRSYV
jgi:hypothetical protein